VCTIVNIDQKIKYSLIGLKTGQSYDRYLSQPYSVSHVTTSKVRYNKNIIRKKVKKPMKKVLLSSLLVSTVAYADIHTSLMEDVEFRESSESTYQTEMGSVTVNYRGMGYEYKRKEFLKSVVISGNMMPDFLEQIGINPNRCRTQSINAYDVDSGVLNQPRLYELVNWSDPNRSQLYGSTPLTGIYDRDNPGRDIVTIYTDVGMYNPERGSVISHELAHFWHDQLCLSSQINSEAFAQQFEDFYNRNKFNTKYRTLDSLQQVQ
jgi:hypothetical protein